MKYDTLSFAFIFQPNSGNETESYAIKSTYGNEQLILATAWINFENILQVKEARHKTVIYCMIPFICKT